MNSRFREQLAGRLLAGRPVSRRSQLSQFIERTERRRRRRFASYDAFHAYSVAEFREFWRDFVAWSALVMHGSPEPVCIGDTVEHARFFPELSLNYAEILLAGDDDRLAVIGCGIGRTVRISRGDLRARVRRAATGLSGLGIGPGDAVAAIAYNDLDAVVACLASAALGATFSAAAPDMAAPTILGRFGQLAPKILFAHTDQRPGNRLEQTLADVIAGLPTLCAVVTLGDGPAPAACETAVRGLADLVEGCAKLPAWPRFAFDHPLFVLFSSGTTGVPKGIVHGAGGTLLEHFKELRLHCDLRPGERLFFQTACSWMMWNWQLSALACGATIVLNDRPVDGPGALWSIVSEHAVDVFGTSPAYLKLCETAGYVPINEHALPRLRAVLSTGAVLHDSQYDWVARDVKRVPVQSISGGTDIIGCFVLGHPDLPVVRGEAQCRSLALDVVAVGPGGAVLGPDEVGDLVCRTPFPSRPLGLLGDRDGARFHDAYFRENPGLWTHGDRVAFTVRGGARFHGRSDGVLNVRGIRLGSAEIHAALQDVSEIADAMAVEQDMPDDPAGARIVLLVVLRPDATLTPDLVLRLRRHIARRAGAAYVPGVIADVAELPVTHNAKRSETAARDAVNHRPVRNREALANPGCLAALAAHPALRRGPAPVRAMQAAQSTSDKLAAIWTEAFGVEGIDEEDDFFALGGDSLLAVAVCSRVEEVFGYNLPIAALFSAPTIAALARLLDEGIVWQGQSPLVLLQPGIGRPVFLLHSIVGNVFEWHDLVARLDTARPVVAFQARGLDPRKAPAETVETMAADYVGLIRERQPRGPYALLGYSFGGLLAYEIAHRLSDLGERLELLGLIDTDVRAAALPPLEHLRFRLQRLRHLGERLAALGFGGGLRRLRDKALGDRADAPRRQHGVVAHAVLPPVLRQVRAACERAFLAYTPPRAGLDVTFFRSPERRLFFCDPLIVWRARAASVRVVDVPGSHVTMLLEPNVGALAAEIARRLAPPEATEAAPRPVAVADPRPEEQLVS